MSTQTTHPFSLLHFSFDDLYARHLGRHSQFGINVAHLGALYGMWFGAYAAIYQTALLVGTPAAWGIVVALAVSYLALVSVNAPYQVCLATAAFLTIFVASVLALPELAVWSIILFLLMVPIFYKLQAWSHKVWTTAADMTEFNRRLPPGRTLASILIFYEVPTCLDYLLFHRTDWRR